MNTPDPLNTHIVWKLKELMDARGVTQYALQKKSEVALNTIRSLYSGTTRWADPAILNKIINALRSITGQDIRLGDILEWREETV